MLGLKFLIIEKFFFNHYSFLFQSCTKVRKNYLDLLTNLRVQVISYFIIVRNKKIYHFLHQNA